jgi:rubrerythrin
MKRERILADVETVADAKKAEETVKTGYAEVSVETILNWIGVEEDLASSYEYLAAKSENASRKGMLQQLARESRDNVASLTALRKTFEDLDRARVARINLLASMNP